MPRLAIPPRARAYRLLFVLALGTLALDQATKAWIAWRLPFPTYYPPDCISIVPDFFHIVHVGNTGAAWGLFQGQSLWLALLACVTLGAIFLYRRQLGLRLPVVQVAFGLLIGGVVGNLVDRVLYGHVVDFLDFHLGSFIWPTFNVADIGICSGVGLYLLASFRHPELKL